MKIEICIRKALLTFSPPPSLSLYFRSFFFLPSFFLSFFPSIFPSLCFSLPLSLSLSHCLSFLLHQEALWQEALSHGRLDGWPSSIGPLLSLPNLSHLLKAHNFSCFWHAGCFLMGHEGFFSFFFLYWHKFRLFPLAESVLHKFKARLGLFISLSRRIRFESSHDNKCDGGGIYSRLKNTNTLWKKNKVVKSLRWERLCELLSCTNPPRWNRGSNPAL